MLLHIGNFMYYFKKGFYMIRKNLHMKIKRIFCGILTAAMLAFMNYWNEYYWASMVLTTKELKTVPAILAQFQNAFSTNYNGMFSAIVVILLPPVILFCCFSKYFIEALSGGAVKG